MPIFKNSSYLDDKVRDDKVDDNVSKDNLMYIVCTQKISIDPDDSVVLLFFLILFFFDDFKAVVSIIHA